MMLMRQIKIAGLIFGCYFLADCQKKPSDSDLDTQVAKLDDIQETILPDCTPEQIKKSLVKTRIIKCKATVKHEFKGIDGKPEAKLGLFKGIEVEIFLNIPILALFPPGATGSRQVTLPETRANLDLKLSDKINSTKPYKAVVFYTPKLTFNITPGGPIVIENITFDVTRYNADSFGEFGTMLGETGFQEMTVHFKEPIKARIQSIVNNVTQKPLCCLAIKALDWIRRRGSPPSAEPPNQGAHRRPCR